MRLGAAESSCTAVRTEFKPCNVVPLTACATRCGPTARDYALTVAILSIAIGRDVSLPSRGGVCGTTPQPSPRPGLQRPFRLGHPNGHGQGLDKMLTRRDTKHSAHASTVVSNARLSKPSSSACPRSCRPFSVKTCHPRPGCPTLAVHTHVTPSRAHATVCPAWAGGPPDTAGVILLQLSPHSATTAHSRSRLDVRFQSMDMSLASPSTRTCLLFAILSTQLHTLHTSHPRRHTP